jgi:hypothetical protein
VRGKGIYARDVKTEEGKSMKRGASQGMRRRNINKKESKRKSG